MGGVSVTLLVSVEPKGLGSNSNNKGRNNMAKQYLVQGYALDGRTIQIPRIYASAKREALDLVATARALGAWDITLVQEDSISLIVASETQWSKCRNTATDKTICGCVENKTTAQNGWHKTTY